MDKKIIKIVLTGGPCGGKTTGVDVLEKRLQEKGWKVVIVNETATELILNGVTFPAFNCDDYEFEKSVIKFQILKERFYEDVCKRLPADKILMVCDRGIMDCMSYVTKELFERILSELGEDIVHLRDKYAGVFHLTTAANGAEEAYTTANNKARSETPEQARALDDKTLNCWVGHPHLRVIDNSTDFEGKIDRVIQEVYALIGEPITYEIERRFLIEKPDLKYLESLPNCNKVDIVQTYLKTNDGNQARVRQRGIDGNYVYTHTTKSKVSNMKRVEIEKPISQEEYVQYLTKADPSLRPIRKERYCLLENGKYFEIDVFPFAEDRALMEIELLREDEKFVIPPYIKVVKEVTNDKTFSNQSIAKKVPFELAKAHHKKAENVMDENDKEFD